ATSRPNPPISTMTDAEMVMIATTPLQSPSPARATAAPEAPRYDPRTRALIEVPIAATLIRLAAPNVLVLLAPTSVGLVQLHFVAPGRDVFRRQSRPRSAGRRRAGISGGDADADDVGRRHGRRHVVGDRARARRRAARRC